MRAHILNPDQIRRIDEASLEMLQRFGVEIPHAAMQSAFHEAGARVDRERQRVFIPPELVARCLSRAGKRYTLRGRDPSRTAAFGQGRRNYNAIAGEASWLDAVGARRRFPSLADVATAARLCDALPNLQIAGAMADPHEIPVSVRCVEVAATMIRNTVKPIAFWFHDRASARFVNELLIALRGDEERAARFPLCQPFLEPISPLRFPHHGIDLLYETARLNLPVPIGPMAQMGLSAPMSIAGTLAQEHAEILAGVCVTQLIRPGMPVCYGGICHAFDMRTTQMIFAGPEQAIFGVAMTQMGKHYGLPVYINVGLTDSKRPDAQAGLEAGVTLAFGAAAGADIFGHMGIGGVDQAASLDMLVLQDEVIGYVESTLRAIDFSDEALGLNALRDVVAGAQFVDHEHTLERFRRELWFPKVLDRNFYEAWRSAGATSAEERCRQRKEALLADYRPEPLSPELDRELDRIVESARRHLAH